MSSPSSTQTITKTLFAGLECLNNSLITRQLFEKANEENYKNKDEGKLKRKTTVKILSSNFLFRQNLLNKATTTTSPIIKRSNTSSTAFSIIHNWYCSSRVRRRCHSLSSHICDQSISHKKPQYRNLRSPTTHHHGSTFSSSFRRTMATTDETKKNGNSEEEDDFTTIQEGSATMKFPSNQESTVFYNPVQVQNRDLSILMITLFGEQRAIKAAVKAYKKQLIKKQPDFKSLTKEQRKDETQKLTKQVQEYESQLLEKQQNNELGDIINKETSKQSGLTILEALAASGLRSVRYWNEIPTIKHVTINDLEYEAVERAKANLKTNGLYGSNDKEVGDDEKKDNVVLENNENRDYGICPQVGDATHVMYMSRRSQYLRTLPEYAKGQQLCWDVIDLDPYGSASPFIDGAVQAIENGGLLAITCTDMAALGGSHPETAFGRYAGLPIQSAKYLQELALRILLYTVSVSAARYGRTIKPILCVGMDFYIRCFLQVNNDKKGVMDLSLNVGHVYQSTKCSTFYTLPHGQMGGKKGNVYQSIRLDPSTCPDTGAPFKVGGPIWLGPLHDNATVKLALKRLGDPNCQAPNLKLIATRERLRGLLTTVSEEIDAPLFYNLSALSRDLHISSPPVGTFKAALHNAGYEVSGQHKDPMAIKTNAPSTVVWDIMRAWLLQNPREGKSPSEESAAALILRQGKPSIDVDFTIPKGMFQTKSKGPNKISRFPQNPERNWGPKRKASNVVPDSNDGNKTKKQKHDGDVGSDKNGS